MSGRATGEVTTTTLWQLTQPGGRVAHCLVCDRRATWQLVVWIQRGIVTWEHYVTAEAAIARAREMEAALERAGWQRPSQGDRGAAAEPVPRGSPSRWRRLGGWWARPTMVTAGLAALWVWWGYRQTRTAMADEEAPALERGDLRSDGFRFSPA